MIEFLIIVSLSTVCYVTFQVSLRKARMNQKMYEDFLEKGRQRRIDMLYGRDINKD